MFVARRGERKSRDANAAAALRASLKDALAERRPLTTEEAALYVGLAASTLEKRRITGLDCPPYMQGVKFGAVRYRVEDLDEYQLKRLVSSTSRW